MPICHKCKKHCSVIEYPHGTQYSGCCEAVFWGEPLDEEIIPVDEDGEEINEGHMKIGELLDKYGFNSVCENCSFYHEWEEIHPYGATTANETLAECTAPDDSKCPRLKE